MTNLTKEQIQQRVIQHGKLLDIDKFNWDEKTRTFSSIEDHLVIDFRDITNSSITTKGYSSITAGANSSIKAEGEKIVIINRNVFEVIQPKKGDLIQICPYSIGGHLVNGKLYGVPHIIADGILSKIISQKGDVYKVINHEEEKQTFLIKKEINGNIYYSHGNALKEAKESLIYKISDRDLSKWEHLTIDSEVSFEESIQLYRDITGACSEGIRYFVEQNEDKKKKSYIISELLELTKGQYNSEVFEKFFEG